jgi:hypothetical protein
LGVAGAVFMAHGVEALPQQKAAFGVQLPKQFMEKTAVSNENVHNYNPI